MDARTALQQEIALLSEILDQVQQLTAAVRIIADRIERDALTNAGEADPSPAPTTRGKRARKAAGTK